MSYIWFNIGWLFKLFSMANLELSESVYILFLSMISISSLFLFLFFLNIMLNVLLGEKFSLLSSVYASNLLVTSCSALDATLWFFVFNIYFQVIYKFSQYTLIATKKKVTLSTPHCGIPKSVCVLFQMDPSILTLIHLLLISSQMNSIILPCIPMFSSCSGVFSLLNMS